MQLRKICGLSLCVALLAACNTGGVTVIPPEEEPLPKCIPSDCNGICQDGKCIEKPEPECRIGDNSKCKEWQSCMGADRTEGAPGTCQDDPKKIDCHVGDKLSCEEWQECKGFESNTRGAPGRCVGEPACYVGENKCLPKIETCIAYYGRKEKGVPGSCQPKSCTPFDDTTCGGDKDISTNGYQCVPDTDSPTGGFCADLTECFVNSTPNTCGEGETCEGFESQDDGARGTCKPEAGP